MGRPQACFPSARRLLEASGGQASGLRAGLRGQASPGQGRAGGQASPEISPGGQEGRPQASPGQGRRAGEQASPPLPHQSPAWATIKPPTARGLDRYTHMVCSRTMPTNTELDQSNEVDATDQPARKPSRPHRDDMTYINVPIPTDLHRRLRIRQVTEGLVMRDVVTEALEAWL
jgi:hypothetical protein